MVQVKPSAEGTGTVTLHRICNRAAQGIELDKQAFGPETRTVPLIIEVCLAQLLGDPRSRRALNTL